MADLAVDSVRTDRDAGTAEIQIRLTARRRGATTAHMVNPDEIPDDIARALRRWLGYIDVPARTDRP
ncbi:hypothetical protein [Parafrankia sp. FMc2]|uniref:hypothetical protein n=1 Tax=Parafrankia sp. FMc2 TaxID=3233196 RepID=UPI0034D5A36A